jgi:hypothetical protein
VSTPKDSADVLSMFGLNENQTRILFSIEKYLVEEDIKKSKVNKEAKSLWLSEWTQIILDNLNQLKPDDSNRLYNQSEIIEAVAAEHLKNVNSTWYHLIILEVTLFVPYTALGKDKKLESSFKKLKFNKQTQAVKSLVGSNNIMDILYVDRFQKTYSKSITRLSGKMTKIALGLVSVVAIAGITAATAGALAGPIAVALFGSQYVGLSGAALISACLAMAGGGAIAIGGAGIAGGTLAIVGGGALLGLAGGGAIISSATLFVTSVPQLALTQAAKLEVVIHEIILNAQKDVKFAQSVMENYSVQIHNLNAYLTKLKLDREEDKKTITNLEKSIKYMERAYREAKIFVSTYELGLQETES